jgi:hypothetical protein
MIIQIKRGVTAVAATWVGVEGSLFIDLTTKLVYVHDGVTVGGTLVSGLSQAAINQLIDTKLDAQTLAIADITGLETALADTLKTADIGNTVASLVGGKVPVGQLPDPVVVPVKATGAELITGTDDTKFATAASLLLLLADIGFTKDGNGEWHLESGVVTP